MSRIKNLFLLMIIQLAMLQEVKSSLKEIPSLGIGVTAMVKKSSIYDTQINNMESANAEVVVSPDGINNMVEFEMSNTDFDAAVFTSQFNSESPTFNLERNAGKSEEIEKTSNQESAHDRQYTVEEDFDGASFRDLQSLSAPTYLGHETQQHVGIPILPGMGDLHTDQSKGGRFQKTTYSNPNRRVYPNFYPTSSPEMSFLEYQNMSSPRPAESYYQGMQIQPQPLQVASHAQPVALSSMHPMQGDSENMQKYQAIEQGMLLQRQQQELLQQQAFLKQLLLQQRQQLLQQKQQQLQQHPQQQQQPLHPHDLQPSPYGFYPNGGIRPADSSAEYLINSIQNSPHLHPRPVGNSTVHNALQNYEHKQLPHSGESQMNVGRLNKRFPDEDHISTTTRKYPMQLNHTPNYRVNRNHQLLSDTGIMSASKVLTNATTAAAAVASALAAAAVKSSPVQVSEATSLLLSGLQGVLGEVGERHNPNVDEITAAFLQKLPQHQQKHIYEQLQQLLQPGRKTAALHHEYAHTPMTPQAPASQHAKEQNYLLHKMLQLAVPKKGNKTLDNIDSPRNINSENLYKQCIPDICKHGNWEEGKQVCSSDGTTFGSPCAFIIESCLKPNAPISIAHEGPCMPENIKKKEDEQQPSQPALGYQHEKQNKHQPHTGKHDILNALAKQTTDILSHLPEKLQNTGEGISYFEEQNNNPPQDPKEIKLNIKGRPLTSQEDKLNSSPTNEQQRTNQSGSNSASPKIAILKEIQNARAQRCQLDCPKTDYVAVCASDRKTYASECEMKAYACLTKTEIFVSHVGPCKKQTQQQAEESGNKASITDTSSGGKRARNNGEKGTRSNGGRDTRSSVTSGTNSGKEAGNSVTRVRKNRGEAGNTARGGDTSNEVDGATSVEIGVDEARLIDLRYRRGKTDEDGWGRPSVFVKPPGSSAKWDDSEEAK